MQTLDIPKIMRADCVRDLKNCSTPNCPNIFTATSAEPEKCSQCHEFELRASLGLLPKNTEKRSTQMDTRAARIAESFSTESIAKRLADAAKKKAAAHSAYLRRKTAEDKAEARAIAAKDKAEAAAKDKAEAAAKRKAYSAAVPRAKSAAQLLPIGTQINDIELLETLDIRQSNLYCNFRCHCGVVFESRYLNFAKGNTKSCGCQKGGKSLLLPNGTKRGALTLIEIKLGKRVTDHRAVVQCDCSNVREINYKTFRHAAAATCTCSRKQREC